MLLLYYYRKVRERGEECKWLKLPNLAVSTTSIVFPKLTTLLQPFNLVDPVPLIQ